MSVSKDLKILQKCEIYLNTFNHMLIGGVSLYITWFCYHFGITLYTGHVWMSTIAYQLLMTEAILAFYSRNTWSNIHTRRTNNHIHWILQLIGSILAIVGTLLLYIPREKHFGTLHSQTGLASLIFMVIALLNGISALWSSEVYKRCKALKPVYSKWFHNLVGILTFVMGMISLYYGYEYTYFQESKEKDVRSWLILITFLTTVFSLIGALVAFFSQTKASYRALTS